VRRDASQPTIRFSAMRRSHELKKAPAGAFSLITRTPQGARIRTSRSVSYIRRPEVYATKAGFADETRETLQTLPVQPQI
jgi:hypothetical protein